jgi:hypothetical protein
MTLRKPDGASAEPLGDPRPVRSRLGVGEDVDTSGLIARGQEHGTIDCHAVHGADALIVQ